MIHLLREVATAQNVLVGAGAVLFLTRSFGIRVGAYFALLPFLTWLEIHTGTRQWTLVTSTMLVVIAFQAIGQRPARHASAATGATAIVLVYVAVVAAQAFNPNLPSATLGLRGARVILEPVLLYFVGAELAQRPDELRRVIGVILGAGAVVVAYAVKQGVNGFDAKELVFYRANFAASAKESRTFSTMAGASVLGNHLAMLAYLILARVVHGTRRPKLWAGYALLCAYAALLTGQRGVYIAALAGSVVAVGLSVARPETLSRGRLAMTGFVAVMGVVLVLLATTPVQDRRNARSTNAFQAARIKLALLKSGGKETSAQLRFERLRELERALERAPEGAGAGLNLLYRTPTRLATASLLGNAGYGPPDYRSKLEPVPGELYYLTIGSELGIVGLALFCGLLLWGTLAAIGVARRHDNPLAASTALATAAFFTFVAVNSLSVDALTSTQVASYFWLLLGLVARWARGLHEEAVVVYPQTVPV